MNDQEARLGHKSMWQQIGYLAILAQVGVAIMAHLPALLWHQVWHVINKPALAT